MAKTTLSLDTIGDLDSGIARTLVDREIQRAVADLDDRGEEDGKTRKVTIQLELTKRAGLVVARVTAEAKMPPRRTGNTAADLKQNGDKPLLYFQQFAPEDPHQETIDTVSKKKG